MSRLFHRTLYSIGGLCLAIILMYSKTDASPLPPYLGYVGPTSASLNIIPAKTGQIYKVIYASDAEAASDNWHHTIPAIAKNQNPITIVLQDLKPDTFYQYQLLLKNNATESAYSPIDQYRFRSQRIKTEPFSFALFSDAHITAGRDERIQQLASISAAVGKRKPEFVAMLGDNIQTFNSHGGPLERKEYGPYLYLRFRYGLGILPANLFCFYVLGNWEGENGWHPEEKRVWARETRLRYIPNPLPETNDWGGGAYGDYYAFSWGHLLCIVLNVTGYTLTDQAIGSLKGQKDDWTLGTEQKTWLLQTLKKARETFKVIFIHHAVGGGSPDEINARYGRGGGLAAHVGEQATIHAWMQQYGVQALFYGHDHVMTDIEVDGIHYVCVGSAGAPWKFGTQETGYRNYWTDFGYTWVDVGDKGMEVSFVAADNTQLHQFSILK